VPPIIPAPISAIFFRAMGLVRTFLLLRRRHGESPLGSAAPD